MTTQDALENVLERAWAVLAPARAQELTTYPVEIFFGDLQCRVALDQTGGRHLLVPTSDEQIALDDRPSVLSMSQRRLAFGGRSAVYVDVSCGEAELYPEFDDVLTDVLEALSETDKPGMTTLRAVTRWRRLFRSRLLRGLSYQSKIGLFAELTVLSALVAADPKFDVEAWRGPLREPHDFEAPGKCLEVKGIGEEAESVQIHGFEQLDTHDERSLDLLLLTVLADPEGSTIKDLVQQVRSTTSSRTALRSRLNAAGWSDDTDAPDTDRFSIGELQRVSVDADTPRLVASGLVDGTGPAGVTDVRYRVDLAALLPLAAGASLVEVADEAVRG